MLVNLIVFVSLLFALVGISYLIYSNSGDRPLRDFLKAKGGANLQLLWQRLRGPKEKFRIIDCYYWRTKDINVEREHWSAMWPSSIGRSSVGIFEIHVLFTTDTGPTRLERHWLPASPNRWSFYTHSYSLLRYADRWSVFLSSPPAYNDDATDFVQECLEAINTDFAFWLTQQVKAAVKELDAERTTAKYQTARLYLETIVGYSQYYSFKHFCQQQSATEQLIAHQS